MDEDILISWDTTIIKLFLHSDDWLKLANNILILNATVDFILASKSFGGSLIQIFLPCYAIS